MVVALAATAIEVHVRGAYPSAVHRPVSASAPAAPPGVAPLILVVGDSGAGSPQWERNLEAMAREPALLAVHTGDASYRTSAEYRRFLVDVAALPFPMLVVPGDHDRELDPTMEAFGAAFGPSDRVVNVGPVRAILLDSSREDPTSGTIDFLDREATAWRREVDAAAAAGTPPAQPWCIVVSHTPPWQPGHRYPEGMARGHSMHDLDLARRMVAILRDNAVTLLACGHWHGYSLDDRAGFPMIVSGGGGKDVEPGDDFHYVRVRPGPAFSATRVVTSPGGTSPVARWGDSLLALWLADGPLFTAAAWILAGVGGAAAWRGRASRGAPPGTGSSARTNARSEPSGATMRS